MRTSATGSSAMPRPTRARFLNLLGPLRTYLDVQNVNVGIGDEGRIFVETDAGKFEAPERMSRADRRARATRRLREAVVAIEAEKKAKEQAEIPARLAGGGLIPKAKAGSGAPALVQVRRDGRRFFPG